jgi:hypothetical protein
MDPLLPVVLPPAPVFKLTARCRRLSLHHAVARVIVPLDAAVPRPVVMVTAPPVAAPAPAVSVHRTASATA